MDAGGNIATKQEEKSEVLYAFFGSVFNSQTGYSQGIQPPELEDRDGEKNKPRIIQEEAVNNLLCHVDTYKFMGTDGIHLRVPRELAEELSKPLSIIYQQSWLTGEVPDGWRLSSVTPIFKKGGSGKLWTCEPDLGGGKDYGALHLECTHQARAGQPGDQAEPACVHKRQVLLDQPDLLL